MKTETKVLSGILIFSAIILIVSVLLLSKVSKSPVDVSSNQVFQIDYSKGQKIGTDSAKIKLVEFSDFQCPACKAAEPVVKQVREKYKDNLLFIYRNFPLPQHIHARAAANFAQFAAQEGKFWEIHDKLFETQDEWAKLGDPKDYFANLGLQLGLDKEKIKNAISTSAFNHIIGTDITDGNNYSVDSTPTFFVNGKKVDIAQYTDLDQAISAELNK